MSGAPGGGTSLDEQLRAAAAAGDAPRVEQLLAAGADACTPGGGGVTPLMAAAEAGSAGGVAALLRAGAPWNALDDDGYCAGDYANAGKNPEVIETLLNWGVQCEELLAAMERNEEGGAAAAPANASYLQQRLVYDGDRLIDADGEAVMMGWELPLMVEHAKEICARGGDVLNIGFGLGLVDEEMQKHRPASHTIVEAHPDVHAHMLKLGWDKRPGVTILFGRWQDVLPQLLQKRFDGIFFDTYGEYYEELHAFHQQLPALLKPGGTYSFFNGFASDNAFFHLVYGRLIQLELQRLGVVTRYRRMAVDELGDDVWRGIKNKYWKWLFYFLPTCVLQIEEAPGEEAPAEEAPAEEGPGGEATEEAGGGCGGGGEPQEGGQEPQQQRRQPAAA
ncbi:MAG: S-adenosyl-L-methionine-dependent methyltransferase [Monoraphidium minutum]|nr:MAG: S-adenosyl-L-methionine-dependent methyltransferase [Monoraphidium minutum]